MAFLNSAVATSFSYTASNRNARIRSVADRTVVAHANLRQIAILGFGDDILDHPRDARRRGLAKNLDRIVREVIIVDDPGPHGIVDVVVHVGDEVRHPHDLPFQRRCPFGRVDANRRAFLALGVAADAIANFPGEVQAATIVLEHVDDTQALLVVSEPPGHERVEHTFAGMTEWRVAQVMTKSDRLGQLLVQAKDLGDRARDLRHLECVREPRAIVIAFGGKEDLRLVLQPPKRLRVDDAVPVVLKRRPHIVFGLAGEPSAGLRALGGLRRERLALALFESLTNARQRSSSRKTDTVGKRTDTEVGRKRLPEIRKGATCPEIDAGAHRAPVRRIGTYSRE